METNTTLRGASYRWVYLVAAVLSIGLIGLGGWLAYEQKVWSVLAAGSAALVATLLGYPIASSLATAGRSREALAREVMEPIYERFQQLAVQLNEISEQQLISERAKQIAYRDKDVDALRRTIQDDIRRREWDPALALVDAMESNFGYRAEAETLRQEITARRSEAFRRSLNETVAVIDRFASMEQWGAAFREAERMAAIYPDNEQVRNLPVEIESRRAGFKKKLVDEWYAAVNRKDVDGAIELLRKLDLYLTPAEGEQLQETARHLFKEKISLLRTQFTLAVQEQNWGEAIALGETIMRDFPNTQMAKEVRDNIDALRQRAAGGQPVGV